MAEKGQKPAKSNGDHSTGNRSDMIRAGTYTGARRFKTASSGNKVLFPIPTTQLASNPLLTQNPGY